jgi:hypothetical protein
MVRTTTLVGGAVGGLVAAVGAWNLYRRARTEQVDYRVVGSVDGVELRRYPPTVLAETVAPSESVAFRRLFRYITGANEGGSTVGMTAPVEVSGGDRGRTMAMTAPVEVGRGDPSRDGVRMAFYLPASYGAESAPRPTDDDVDLVVAPPRTLAVRRFSWWATERRVSRQTVRLLAALDDAGVERHGEPFYMGYEGPGTLPFLRRNEVAVEVAHRFGV